MSARLPHPSFVKTNYDAILDDVNLWRHKLKGLPPLDALPYDTLESRPRSRHCPLAVALGGGYSVAGGTISETRPALGGRWFVAGQFSDVARRAEQEWDQAWSDVHERERMRLEARAER